MEKASSHEEINVCQHKLAKQKEYQLKNLVTEIKKRFRGTQKDRFNDAQQLWEKMTNRDCEIEADFYEGSQVYIAILSQCLNGHYQQRIDQIKYYLCPDHSLSKACPASEKFEHAMHQQ